MGRRLIVAVIAIVIGLALLPVVSSFTDNLTVAPVTNTSGTILTTGGQFYGTTVGSLIDLLPILFVIVLVAGTIAGVVIANKRNAG